MNQIKNKVLLIVEDDTAMAGILHHAFTRAGFIVSETHSGREGLDAFIKYRPGLVVTDILMPNMDGLAMIKAIRLIERPPYVPIMVLTNISDIHTIVESLDNGVNDFMLKSEVEPQDVVKRICEKLENK